MPELSMQIKSNLTVKDKKFDLLFIVFVVQEEIHEASQKMNFRKVEEGVVHIDSLVIQL